MNPSTNHARLLVEVSTGELLDKISILRIKQARLVHPDAAANVRRELQHLESVRDQSLQLTPELTAVIQQLDEVNRQLWEIEDAIRDCERRSDFGDQFVQLARSVYLTNDRRAELKREINRLSGSTLMEEKGYSKYR